MPGVLIIRADATSKIGTGHVMRSLALAQAWKARGGAATFLSHCESPAIRQRIESSGIGFIPMKKPHPDTGDVQQTLEIIKQFKIKKSKFKSDDRSVTSHQPLSVTPWVILDGYHFTTDYQQAIRNAGYRLFVIDDMAHLSFYHADVLLNQNIHAESLDYSCDEDTMLLLGIRHILLRPEFLAWKGWKRKISRIANNVLVTFGGSDPDKVTLKVIQALQKVKIADLEVAVVVGPSNPHLNQIEIELNLSSFSFRLLHHVDDMSKIMAWADVSVSAGGTTCWELAFMGLPNIVLVLADNQCLSAEGLDAMGAAINLGWQESLSPDVIEKALMELLVVPKVRMEMSRCGHRLVDGNGVKRVLRYLSGRKFSGMPGS